jgi:uncharacterized membrane protein
MLPGTLRKEDRIHRLFRISVVLKGANALLEIASGFLAFGIRPSVISDIALYLTQGELAKHPNDVFAAHLLNWAQHYSIGSARFAALYLLTHGSVKLGLVIGLLKDQMWAYPTSLAVFGIFVLYQTYLFTLNHSLAMVLLTMFDLIVIWSISREYQIIRAGGRSKRRILEPRKKLR